MSFRTPMKTPPPGPRHFPPPPSPRLLGPWEELLHTSDEWVILSHATLLVHKLYLLTVTLFPSWVLRPVHLGCFNPGTVVSYPPLPPPPTPWPFGIIDTSVIAHTHLLVRATNEQFLPTRVSFKKCFSYWEDNGCNQCWYSPFGGDSHQ